MPLADVLQCPETGCLAIWSSHTHWEHDWWDFKDLQLVRARSTCAQEAPWHQPSASPPASPRFQRRKYKSKTLWIWIQADEPTPRRVRGYEKRRDLLKGLHLKGETQREKLSHAEPWHQYLQLLDSGCLQKTPSHQGALPPPTRAGSRCLAHQEPWLICEVWWCYREKEN